MTFSFKAKPWQILCATPDPIGEGGGGGGGELTVEALQAQIAELQQQNQGYAKLVGKLRPIEDKYQKLESLLGTADPAKLIELKNAEAQLQQQAAEIERQVAAAKIEVSSTYQDQIKALNTRVEAAAQQSQQTQLTFDIFKAYNANGGIGDRFDSFMQLAQGNFRYAEDKSLQVVDDTGKLLIASDDTGNRPASPADFMKMLAANKLEGYQFGRASMLQLTLEAYNKASGAGIPANNGYNSGKAFSEMSQSELSKYAFSA